MKGPWSKMYHQLFTELKTNDAMIFCYILSQACVEDTMIHGMPISRGQCLFVISDLAKLSSFTRKTISAAIKRLEKIGFISMAKLPHNRGFKVTVRDYCKYNGNDEAEVKQTAKHGEKLRGTTDDSTQGKTLYKNQESRIKNKETISSIDSAEKPPKKAKDLLDTYNEHCGALPKCRKLNKTRLSKIKARLKEEPDLSYWASVVKKLAASSFAVSGGWAGFDWIIANDNNHAKATEGKYDDKPSELSQPAQWSYGQGNQGSVKIESMIEKMIREEKEMGELDE